MSNIPIKKNGLFKATWVSFLLLIGNTAYAVGIDFEGVAMVGLSAIVGQNYTESGYNLFNPGAASEGAVVSTSAGLNDTGSDYYTWFNSPENNPVVLTSLGGSNFNLNSLDVGGAFGNPASFLLTGYLSAGGTLVSNVVDASAFTNLVLGWSNLTRVEFAYTSGDFGAIDNINVTAVPIPAAAWLFGSALLGLGVLKRKKA